MIKQARYIDTIVEQFGQKSAKVVDNPCASSLKLSTSQSSSTEAGCPKMRSRPYLFNCLYDKYYNMLSSGYRICRHAFNSCSQKPQVLT
ncbi:hypothetical protein Plhal703r1_c53g0158681 [Plasmopara halstedii]